MLFWYFVEDCHSNASSHVAWMTMQNQMLAPLMLWLPPRWEAAGHKLKTSLSRQALCADTHWDNLAEQEPFGQERILPCRDSLKSIIWRNGFGTSLRGNKMIIQIFRKCFSPIANVSSGVIISFCVCDNLFIHSYLFPFPSEWKAFNHVTWGQLCHYLDFCLWSVVKNVYHPSSDWPLWKK